MMRGTVSRDMLAKALDMVADELDRNSKPDIRYWTPENLRARAKKVRAGE